MLGEKKKGRVGVDKIKWWCKNRAWASQTERAQEDHCVCTAQIKLYDQKIHWQFSVWWKKYELDSENEEHRTDEQVRYEDPGDLCQEYRIAFLIYWTETGRWKVRGEDTNKMKEERGRMGLFEHFSNYCIIKNLTKWNTSDTVTQTMLKYM